LSDIAYRHGEGDELAYGSRWLSEKYGGKEFAIQVKGMEIPAYRKTQTGQNAAALHVY